mgnify:CR=1 FL=1
MEKLKPKLFSVMKTYTREQFVKDVVAGIIVAIIAPSPSPLPPASHRKKVSTLRSQQALSSLFWAKAASRSQVRLQHLQRSSPELLQKTAWTD